MVRVLVDPDGLGPRVRDEQAEDVAHEHGDHAKVKQGARDAHEPSAVKLARPRRPAELVIAVAPDEAHDERR